VTSDQRVTVEVDGRQLTLSNLHKVLYPATGFTKGAVIDYYTRVAPLLLPHLADRPLTVKRYPNGADAPFFYEKNAPRGKPDWVRTVRLPSPGSTKNRDMIDYLVVEEIAALVWLANLAALELHTPQWRAPRDGSPRTDLLVLDLDPGAPAGLAECCEVALLLRDLAAADGLELYPKTSGSKGMQVSAPIGTDDPGAPSRYARTLAQRLEREHPELIVSRMTKALRPGKVLVDWSQNNPAKTTVAPYSLRAREAPTVSTPLAWSEVDAGRSDPSGLRFTADEVLSRIAENGDLFAGVLDDSRRAGLPAGAATGK
jgi:bifunctional non-homologous end joining protein LigD